MVKSVTFKSSEAFSGGKKEVFTFSDLNGTVGYCEVDNASYSSDKWIAMNLFTFLREVVIPATKAQKAIFLKEFYAWMNSDTVCMRGLVQIYGNREELRDQLVLDEIVKLYKSITTKDQLEEVAQYMDLLERIMAGLQNQTSVDLVRAYMWQYYFGYCAKGLEYSEERVTRVRSTRDYLKEYGRRKDKWSLWRAMHSFTGVYALPGPSEFDAF